MTEIHNAELTQEMINGAVAAWLEQTSDSAIIIDVGFQRDVSHESNFDLIAKTTINILKASDFRPMKRGEHDWTGEDQNILKNLRRGRRTKNIERKPVPRVPGYMDRLRKMLLKLKFTPRQPRKIKKAPLPVQKPTDVKKFVARKWELPSAEYYPIRYVEGVRRQLTTRKSATEMETAQEAPAIREKGESLDKTDQDCRSIPADATSSKESMLSEASIQKSDNSLELAKEPEKPVVKEEPKKEEPKIEEKKEEPPVKTLEEPKKEPKEEPKEEPKVEEPKKAEEPQKSEQVLVPVKKSSKRNVQMSLKRRPDSGELTILAEHNGMVTFSCSTKHRTRKTSKSQRATKPDDEKSEKSEATKSETK